MRKRMNPEIKAKWVAALRSGEYKQGTCFLRKDYPDRYAPDFCCLGVLCDIAAKEGIIDWEIQTWHGGETWYASSTKTLHDKNSERLPACVMEWAGLDKVDPDLMLSDWRRSVPVSELNDRERLDFERIAELIEGQL